uniref:Uncharacterized protein n=1 Tax=Plectus sambesii TaxID=2011161 RepID=A0A914V9W7_9BILA
MEVRGALLQKTLNALIPEFGPFGCYHGSLFDSPNIEATVEQIHRDAPEQLIVLPEWAHYNCYSTGSALNKLTSVLQSRSQANIRSGEVDESCRSLFVNSDAFELTPPVRWTLVDRWASHPVLSDSWSKLIEQHVASFPEDVQESIGIVFCAPFKRFYGSIDYKHEISASCVRTI